MEDLGEEVKRQGVRYLQAWRALGVILRDGGSWSGHERNCCFLNTQSGQFADISSLAGLDQRSDSRAIAIVDWDHDGDLDLWYSNRTAPRVRYLQNNSRVRGRFLAVRLRGMQCNRDAIGARVELATSRNGEQHTSIQTLRGGEGFLAQSSKWLHFGLGQAEPVRMTIHWPGGEAQTIARLQSGRRYLVVEGQQPVELPAARDVKLTHHPLPEPNVGGNVRIIPARRLPMPDLRFVDDLGKAVRLPEDDQFLLLTIWATWCKPCISELKALDARAADLGKRGIRWLPVNVDAFEAADSSVGRQAADQLLARLGMSTATVYATPSSIECLDVAQRVLVTKQDPLPVPCSFLLDRLRRLVAVYKGTVTADQVIRDLGHLERPTADPRNPAVPFPGRWCMGPFPSDLMAIPSELANIGRTLEALEYLIKHVPTTAFEPPLTADQVTYTYLKIARDLVANDHPQEAELALQQALEVDSTNLAARMALAEIFLRQHRSSDAMAQYRASLERAPQHRMSLNNLAWLLATAADGHRNPREAVVLAERLCQQADNDDPAAFDTLAVALAADGQFERATEQLEKAIRLAKQRGRETARMEARLRLFRAGTSYVEQQGSATGAAKSLATE